MTDNTSSAQDIKNHIINDEDGEQNNIVPIKSAKLLKLQHNIKKLREEIIDKLSKELEECKTACNSANSLIGELHDDITKEEC